MKIIFVRHGETAENLAHRHQPEYTPLTINGRKQAITVGKQLKSIGATHIVSSPLVRTLQTASLIADQLNMIPSIDYTLVELKRPPTMTGYTHRSFRSLFFYQRWYLGLTSTGESYRQIRKRVKEAQINLVRLPPDSTVVVVSHSVFINIFLAHMCNARMMNPIRAVVTFFKLVTMKNTATHELTYTPISNGCQWQRTNDLNLS